MPRIDAPPANLRERIGSHAEIPESFRPSTGAADDTFDVHALRETRAINISASSRPILIVDVEAKQKVWPAWWFPATDVGPGGPDGQRNMAGPGGVCQTYDRAFGKSSQAEELRVFRFGYGERERTGWFGHCDKAAMVAATMPRPINAVTHNGEVFEPDLHITGLLEEVVDSMCVVTAFHGKRYNGPSDDPNDIGPAEFLQVLLEWQDSGAEFPIILDKSPEEQVWNQSYDFGKVWESDLPMAGMPSNVPYGAGIKFYQFELRATGNDGVKRFLQAWVQRDFQGNVRRQGWIVGTGQDRNPDFVWQVKPVGDLSKLQTWNRLPSATQHNKQIMPYDVGRIYLASRGLA